MYLTFSLEAHTLFKYDVILANGLELIIFGVVYLLRRDWKFGITILR